MKRTPGLRHFLFASALTAASANAVSVVTDPVGFISLSAKAGSVAAPVTTYIGLSMTRPVAYQGAAASASTVNQATVVSVPNGGFTSLQFGPGAGSVSNYYLEVINGPGAGTMSQIASSSATSITLVDNISTAFANDGTTTFRVRPNWTFGTAFGATNESGLQAGTSVDSADVINLINPLNGASTGYYYNSTLAKWVTASGNNDATNVPIAPDAGLQLARKGTSDLTFKLAGAVKTGPTALYVNGSTSDTFNQITNPYATESVLLKDIGLYTGNENTGVAGDVSAATADIVQIQDFVHNQVNDFYYNTNDGRWKTGTTDASAFVVAPGSSVTVIRRANRNGFYWFDPQPGIVLGDTPLSLALVSAASRKAQGSFGDVDLNIPLSGSTATEPRNSQTGNLHTIVFNFSNNVTSGTAVVSAGIGSVASTSFNGKTMTVNLKDVTDAQLLTVTLTNVYDTNGQNLASTSVSLKLLSGDVTNNSTSNSSDVAATKSSSGELNAGNVRSDLNVNGTVNSSDIALAKSKSGNSL